MPRIGSPGVGLPYPSTNSNLTASARTLAAGAIHIIPAGIYNIVLGPYTVYQVLDPISGLWQITPLGSDYIESDGVNFRLANLTGCAVGALVTTAGTGYLVTPTVTPSAGASKWQAYLGGSLTTAQTPIPTAGTGYNHLPQVLVPAPPVGGVQATAVVGLSGTGLSGVTIINAGAGYTNAVTPIIVPHPLDASTVTNVAVMAALPVNTNLATNITAILCTDPGTAQTLPPALSITAAPLGGTTAIAAPVMMFTVTGITVVNAGLNYQASSPFNVFAPGALCPGTRSVTAPNPFSDTGLFQPAPFFGYGTTGTGVQNVTSAGFIVSNGGMHQTIPNLYVSASAGSMVATQVAQVTALCGGVSDTSFIVQIV